MAVDSLSRTCARIWSWLEGGEIDRSDSYICNGRSSTSSDKALWNHRSNCISWSRHQSSWPADTPRPYSHVAQEQELSISVGDSDIGNCNTTLASVCYRCSRLQNQSKWVLYCWKNRRSAKETFISTTTEGQSCLRAEEIVINPHLKRTFAIVFGKHVTGEHEWSMISVRDFWTVPRDQGVFKRILFTTSVPRLTRVRIWPDRLHYLRW